MIMAAGPSWAAVTGSSACAAGKTTAWEQELHRYLAQPKTAKTKTVAVQLCQGVSRDQSSCPAGINEETVSKLETAAMKTPEVLPVVACAAKKSRGAVARDLSGLLGRMLDKHGTKFLKSWQKFPKEIKSLVPKWEDFVTVTPEDGDPKARTTLLQGRLHLLMKAPTSLKRELAPVIEILRDEVQGAQTEKSGPDDGEITFRRSLFRKLLVDKLLKLKNPDQARVAAAANETILNEGLNYKAYLKGTSRNWNVCSATIGVDGSCHSSDVRLETAKDSCGTYALMGVLAQGGDTWIVMSDSSAYRISTSDILAPRSVTLQHADVVLRSWNVPEGFVPSYLSPDLRVLVLTTTLESDAGKQLGELYLTVTDTGHFRFTATVPDLNRDVEITAAAEQTVKGLDGGSLQLHLPKSCP